MSYTPEVYIRPKDVKIGAVDLDSVVEIVESRPPGTVQPLIADGHDMPTGMASEQKATEYTVSVVFNDYAEAKKLMDTDGVADLTFDTNSAVGRPGHSVAIKNCCAWGQGSEGNFARSPNTYTVNGKFFDHVDADPETISVQT